MRLVVAILKILTKIDKKYLSLKYSITHSECTCELYFEPWATRRMVFWFSNTGEALVLFVWQVIFCRGNLYRFKSVQHSTMHAFIYNRSYTNCIYSFQRNRKSPNRLVRSHTKASGISKYIHMNMHELNDNIYIINNHNKPSEETLRDVWTVRQYFDIWRRL